MSWYTSSKLWCFVGGMAATCVGGALSRNTAVRNAAVNGVAQGMLLKEGAQDAMQSIKDDAEDVCADARTQAKVEAARSARMAEIEERVRKQVEDEMVAEEAKAEADAAKEAKTAKPKK